MLKLRTKTEFTVPTERGTTQAIVRLIIDAFERMDDNNIIPNGYYYYYDADGKFHQLDKISNKPMLWSDIEMLEPSLPTMASNVFLKQNLLQRLNELTFYKLAQENGTNYDTLVSDWEIDEPIIEEPTEPEV